MSISESIIKMNGTL